MKKTVDERFWNNVVKTGSCWLWNASKIPSGYGRFVYNRKFTYSHRMVWFLTYGYFPKLFVCHKCDNPSCVRPSHLFEGTPKENTQDAIKKGRRKGKPIKQLSLNFEKSRFKTRKLTFKQASEIRLKYINKEYSQQELSKLYNVGHTTIEKIIHFKRYLK